jgi:hypothetical protein
MIIVLGGRSMISMEFEVPSGKQPHTYGKSPFLMGKSTIKWSFSIANC